MLLGIWVLVVTIQILVQGIHSAMAIGNAIRIEHGNEHKNKILSQQERTMILLIKQKVDDPIHGVTGWSLNGMHSSADKDNRLIITKFNNFFIPQTKNRIPPQILIAFFTLMR